MNQVAIYTDGACKRNGKPNSVGGWSAILIYGSHRKELTGHEKNTTNNRMELMGAISGLEALNQPYTVDLYTDSQYLRNGIVSWIKGWKRKGWKTKTGSDVKNRDLWERLDFINQIHSVRWHWVRGHADDAINNRADELANAAAASGEKEMLEPEVQYSWAEDSPIIPFMCWLGEQPQKAGEQPLRIAERIRRSPSALSPKQLADVMGCTESNITKKAKAGKIPCYRFGGSIKFDPVVTADWLENQSMGKAA